LKTSEHNCSTRLKKENTVDMVQKIYRIYSLKLGSGDVRKTTTLRKAVHLLYCTVGWKEGGEVST
jgi:hypothetical protein